MSKNEKDTSRKLSPEDELYKRLTGKVFAKAGTAYEKLATAVAKIVLGAEKAKHNVFCEGYSGVNHQLDGVIGSNIILEAKDYSIRGAKVGLEEVQNHQGAMSDLEVAERGLFASATDFTSEAKKYVNATGYNPKLTSTDIAIIRHSIPQDEVNRIKKFVIHITMPYLDTHNAKYSLLLCDADEATRFNNHLQNVGQRVLTINLLYNRDGSVLTTIEDLTASQIPNNWPGQKEISGCFNVEAYVHSGFESFHISGINYRIPVKKAEEEFTVEANGDACVLVKSPTLGIDKLITDTDLKKELLNLE